MVAKLSDFEMSKQLGISGAMAHYREQPSPEAALAVHGALIAFQQWEEAHKFRDLALEEHKESAVLHAGLATQLMQRGRLDDAVPLFEKALELRSDLPEARTGVARIRMAQGKLEEARELLGFLELPGAGQLYPLEALELLAQAYQRAGRHAETIALAKHIIDELPPVGQVYAFRKFVARSEKALRSGTTVLPKRVRTMRGLFDPRHGPFAKWERLLALGTIVVVTIAVTAAALNTFWQQRRVVYLVSESGTPYEVTIDGQPFPQTGRLTRVRLAEGKHRVKIAGPTLEEFDMNMATNYVERWTRDPIWVVNVDGGMALLNATLRYSANPKATQGRVLMGGPWFYFPHVDYAFSPPPQTVNIGQGSGEATKVYVDCAPQAAQQLFQYALQSCPLPAAFRFGEARLRKDHQDALLLDAYVEAAKEKGQTDRAREFLKAGLDGRPVAIVWHRAYQDVCTATGRTAAVAAQYDALLAKEPDSAALLYLRGRVDGDHIKGQMFFDRACQADPRLGWPWMALAYDAATMGDWPRGRQLADKAFELKLDCPSLQVLRHLARLATGDTAAMKTEYHDRLQAGSPEKNVPVRNGRGASGGGRVESPIARRLAIGRHGLPVRTGCLLSARRAARHSGPGNRSHLAGWARVPPSRVDRGGPAASCGRRRGIPNGPGTALECPGPQCGLRPGGQRGRRSAMA
jgi:tetratricopeptide (TPR) repeat protein